jgi:hypothetical protein
LTVGKVGDSGKPPPYLPGLISRPSPEDQVRFIANIERILSEGSFVATYKYALLVALVELAIERGDDSNRELALPIRDIADKFAELYWRQAAPYEADGASGLGFVLHQNQGRQAGAITRLPEVAGWAEGSRSTLAEARRTVEWNDWSARCSRCSRPCRCGDCSASATRTSASCTNPGPGTSHITLLPGVACHLRERAPLIRRLAQTEWLRFVLSLEQNQPALGRAVGLSEFLFGSNRAALSLKVSEPLRELQHGRCFYCEGSLRGGRGRSLHPVVAIPARPGAQPRAGPRRLQFPQERPARRARSTSGAGRSSSRITIQRCSRSAPKRACSSIARRPSRSPSGAMGTPSGCGPRYGSVARSTGTFQQQAGDRCGLLRSNA